MDLPMMFTNLSLQEARPRFAGECGRVLSAMTLAQAAAGMPVHIPDGGDEPWVYLAFNP
jgi:hypothetical protein